MRNTGAGGEASRPPFSVSWYNVPMKTNIIIVLLAILVVIGGFFLLKDTTIFSSNEEMIPVEADGGIGDGAEPLPEVMDEAPLSYERSEVIGTSVEGREIVAHQYGIGEKELLFIGGVHGGYAWNTAAVAYELMSYLSDNEDRVPEGLTVTVIPVLNPDGLAQVVEDNNGFSAAAITTTLSENIPARFNANNVDLNRNFDCEWQAEGVWQSRVVSGGSAPFSEPEANALKQYVETHKPAATIVWYSAAGGVYASNCRGGVSAETKLLTNLYADASGYPAYEEFDFYEVTGDMVNWLAKEGYPAISVLLTKHGEVEWSQNQSGIEAMLNYYSQ